MIDTNESPLVYEPPRHEAAIQELTGLGPEDFLSYVIEGAIPRRDDNTQIFDNIPFQTTLARYLEDLFCEDPSNPLRVCFAGHLYSMRSELVWPMYLSVQALEEACEVLLAKYIGRRAIHLVRDALGCEIVLTDREKDSKLRDGIPCMKLLEAIDLACENDSILRRKLAKRGFIRRKKEMGYVVVDAVFDILQSFDGICNYRGHPFYGREDADSCYHGC